MGLDYKLVLWNKHKKTYDKIIVLGMLAYLVLFFVLSFLINPELTAETVIIRAFGSLAILMLHIILAIGPLSRLNPQFLPILYNRRHLGVSMFLAAFIHGGISIFQFHALGSTNPIYAIFTSNMEYGSLTNFPFQVLGFLALLILFLMASTSHDFFLKNLSPRIWKGLHMLVYLAYALVVMHVFLGAFQQETSPFTMTFLILGFVTISGLHLVAAFKESKVDGLKSSVDDSGWLEVCNVNEIANNRAKIFTVAGERVAIFKYDGKLSAIHNVCKHQGGPLGEGKVVDGCITCPWHGYQYLPHNGQSPPPFTEKVITYELRLSNGIIYINPNGFSEGTEVKPLNY
ncbi:Rieske 2Fe-2S domain-containing protein [Flagellimonas flava]|uniref:Ferredoxin subunit of nitrite reductase or a ring-hydroxylating dioxygenase n=1 Tax=Flagellimonas flava TaxID=570519 RepID=A0A1M5N9H4_9FLAO|nr:Rieske 2Fe-2S domain-containing protein [Allomuricauda flava]SHG85849.1 Ferredoxin subunit of nitrite reductase or a ring-hydroxylating dioxygenase [Allomuricauda flava]